MGMGMVVFLLHVWEGRLSLAEIMALKKLPVIYSGNSYTLGQVFGKNATEEHTAQNAQTLRIAQTHARADAYWLNGNKLTVKPEPYLSYLGDVTCARIITIAAAKPATYQFHIQLTDTWLQIHARPTSYDRDDVPVIVIEVPVERLPCQEPSSLASTQPLLKNVVHVIQTIERDTNYIISIDNKDLSNDADVQELAKWQATIFATVLKACSSVTTQKGGGRRKVAKTKKVATWVSQGRKVATKQGTVRTLYRNTATGEMRVKRIAIRGGRRVAVYVKP